MNVFSKKVGFIGAGNMASAIISGMITAGFKPKNIIASAPTKSHLKSLSDTFLLLSPSPSSPESIGPLGLGLVAPPVGELT